MKHLKSISLPKYATVAAEDPVDGGGGLGGEDVVNILDTVFAFVLQLVTVKGKGVSA